MFSRLAAKCLLEICRVLHPSLPAVSDYPMLETMCHCSHLLPAPCTRGLLRLKV